MSLSFDNFNSQVLATIAGQKNLKTTEEGLSELKFELQFEQGNDDDTIEMYTRNQNLVMAESTSLFEVIFFSIH